VYGLRGEIARVRNGIVEEFDVWGFGLFIAGLVLGQMERREVVVRVV